MDIGSVDIAAVSTQMAAQKVQASVQTAVLKNAMDVQSQIAETLIGDLMAMAPTASKIDIGV